MINRSREWVYYDTSTQNIAKFKAQAMKGMHVFYIQLKVLFAWKYGIWKMENLENNS